ncbi:MAG: uracil-DNA glycosylase [Bacteroidota bacterium]|nr:uracil-DNA glycosylase [Bacteroidota bacterium]
MTNQDIDKILSDAKRFLQQEQLLFGNTIYKESMKSKKKLESPGVEEPVLFTELPSAPKESWQGTSTLDVLNKQICTCMKCGLGKTRTNFVFGVGNPNADVMVIGEAPGADEDAKGEPFVGRAGQLLNKILEAINFKREEVYIANILKCRPPENRRPTPEEAELCEPYLWKQIDLIKPKIILCLGLTAGQTLLKTTESLTQLRASTQLYRNTPVIVTYHPAALLRNPHWKVPTWEDVKKLRKMYDEMKNN